jgi:hypothetical protein
MVGKESSTEGGGELLEGVGRDFAFVGVFNSDFGFGLDYVDLETGVAA